MDISFAFRKIQKSIAGFSILAVLASLVSFTGIASASTFPDVDSDHYAYDAVDEASDEGWMTGYDNGDFGVDDTLTRGQAAKLLVAGSDLDTVEDCETDFTDVPTSYSLYDYVCSAEAYGFVGGYTDSDGDATGEYGPNDSVNRAQFAKMVVEAFGLTMVDDALDEFPDVDEGVWYEMSPTWYVSSAWANTVINGYDNGNFYPAYDVTRGQAALMINRAQEPEWRVDDEEEEDETEESDGDLTVEVSSDSPDAMTIPSNATSVELAAWDFTANGGDVTIDSLSVHHYGITSLSSTHQVYLYEGSTRLSSGTTVGSTNNEATFTYDIEVESGETRTISVRMDMGDYTSTGEVGLEIASASKIDASGASIDGDFPAQGAKHTISTTDAGSVTIEKNGTVDNAQVGEDGATIGKFKITSATEAAGVEELGVYLSGSINTADVENFGLYLSGSDELLAEVTAVDDLDVIRFDISGDFDGESDECENSDGFCIAKGGSKSFYITADFNTGRTDDTVKVYIDQNTDVYSKGALYGSGMQVTRTAYDGDSCTTTAGDCSYSVLEGGDITISSNGPSAGDIATNARDASLLDFSIVSVTDVTFDSFPISLDTSEAESTEGLLDSTTSNFTDIKIVNSDTGSALFAGVDSSVFVAVQGGTNTIQETADSSDGDEEQSFYLFTDNFEMDAGEELNLSLTADVRNLSTLDGMTIVGALDLGTTYPQLKDSNNKTLTNSSVLVPASAVTGKTMTVRTPTLALSLASTPVSNGTAYVKGSDGVPFTGIVMSCGDASDCNITSVSLIGTIDESVATVGTTPTFASTASTPGVDNSVNVNAIVGSVWLEDDEGNVVEDSEESVTASTGAVTMDSLDISIPAGDSPVYTVVGDIKSDAFKNSDAEAIAFKITSASSVVAEDEEGNGITVSGTVNHPSATTASTWAFVSNGGTLTVAVDSSTAREDIAVAGSSDVEASTFKFTTTAEGFTIKKLAFNADQNGVTTTDIAEFDNQVSKVYITYTDSTGTEVTKSGSLVSGNVTFTGLDLYVGKDDSETVVVTVDLNSIASGQATAGDPVRIDMAFNNFEALAESSGETYKAEDSDATVVDTGAYLSFGTPTWVDGDAATDVAISAGNATAGTSFALEVDDDDDASQSEEQYPVGTLLCVDEGEGGSCSGETILVVTAFAECTAAATPHASCADALEDVYTVTTVDDAGGAAVTDEALLYSLPGDGFLTSTNPRTVYESRPTLTLASSSPSGTQTVSADDSAFIFTVSANSAELVQIRAAVEENDTILDGLGTPCAISAPTTAGNQVDGTSALCTLDSTSAGDSFVWAVDSGLQNYARVNFWIKQTEGGGGAPQFADLNVVTSTAQATFQQVSALSQTACGADQATMVTTEWYNCDVAMPAGTDSSDLFLGIEIDEATEFNDTDLIYVDELKFYNEKIVIDMTTDVTDVDTYANNSSNAAAPSGADLKDGTTTLATGYWSTFTNGASSTNSAILTLIPTTAIEIAKGTSETYTLHIDSADLLAEDSGSDDPVTFSIDSGSSVDGTVTAGDFWWNETNTLTSSGIAASTIKWLGDVTSKLSGNTLVY